MSSYVFRSTPVEAVDDDAKAGRPRRRGMQRTRRGASGLRPCKQGRTLMTPRSSPRGTMALRCPESSPAVLNRRNYCAVDPPVPARISDLDAGAGRRGAQSRSIRTGDRRLRSSLRGGVSRHEAGRSPC